MKTYKSRRHQMMAFARAVTTRKRSLRGALRDAAMCGAVEERHRTLCILRKFDQPTIAGEITQVAILEVLGYANRHATVKTNDH